MVDQKTRWVEFQLWLQKMLQHHWSHQILHQENKVYQQYSSSRKCQSVIKYQNQGLKFLKKSLIFQHCNFTSHFLRENSNDLKIWKVFFWRKRIKYWNQKIIILARKFKYLPKQRKCWFWRENSNLFLVYNHCIIIFHVSLHLLKFMKIIIIIRFEKKVKKGSSK